MASLKPLRTQYPPQLSNIKFRTPIQTAKLTRQWETFERVENYNDIVYQQLQQGNRGTLYYQFADRVEYNDYLAGQTLHINFYTTLPVSTFAPISTRPMPNVVFSAPPPMCVPSGNSSMPLTSATAASVTTTACADKAIYTQVSSFNTVHVYKYNFTSAEELLSYQRAERAIDAAKIPSVPDFICRN